MEINKTLDFSMRPHLPEDLEQLATFPLSETLAVVSSLTKNSSHTLSFKDPLAADR